MTATQSKQPVAKPAAKPEPPTAMHREAPFGKDGGALYFNKPQDRWFAQVRFVGPDSKRISKAVRARSRDDAYQALVALRTEHGLGEPAETAAPKPDAVAETAAAIKGRAKTAAAKEVTTKRTARRSRAKLAAVES